MSPFKQAYSVGMDKSWDAAQGSTGVTPEMKAQTSAPSTAAGGPKARCTSFAIRPTLATQISDNTEQKTGSHRVRTILLPVQEVLSCEHR